MPQKNQIDSSADSTSRSCSSIPYTSYQKIRFKTKKTTITTMAQKIGFCQIVVAPSSGIGVTPYTSPASCSVGTGLVTRLTTTVTITQIIQLHSARYRFSAIGFASELLAMYRKAPAFVCTQINIPIDETVPASNPRNPPQCEARFHSMPKITVPNNGAMKNLNSACT